jgi:hypothetical protein
VTGFFVEFGIANEDRFQRLAVVFDALRTAKLSDEWHDDQYWLAFFDQEARRQFWWPSDAEREDWKCRWFATPTPERFTDPSLKTPWDFGSMIDAFQNGDYDLLRCERVSERVGRLVFEPHNWPYGGTGCMRALVESFGHRVIAESGA